MLDEFAGLAVAIGTIAYGVWWALTHFGPDQICRFLVKTLFASIRKLNPNIEGWISE